MTHRRAEAIQSHRPQTLETRILTGAAPAYLARRGTPQWQTFFDLMVPQNQEWTKNAAALLVFVSKSTFDFNGKPYPTHSFDTGAAWENLALQGWMKGYVVHGMQGFDYDKAKTALKVPDEYRVEAMIAVGNVRKYGKWCSMK